MWQSKSSAAQQGHARDVLSRTRVMAGVRFYKMTNIVDIKSKNPLLGTWRCCDGFSDVEYTVTVNDGTLTVVGTDKHDGESAEIRDVVWSTHKNELHFSAYWPSSGRFVKYRLQPSVAPDRADVTYTYTAQETWERI